MITNKNRLAVILLLSTLNLLVVIAIGYRAVRNYHQPGPLDGVNFGFCDYHNGIYWPAVSVLERVSPYGEEYTQRYPVSRASPIYMPSIFLWHLPLGAIPIEVGEWIYFLAIVGMAGTLAWLAMKAAGGAMSLVTWLMILLLVLTSRSGYGTLFAGYFTFELVIGTIIAIHWGHRPGWGGLGFALAAGKPTYAIPLFIMMIARGHWRAALCGAMMASLLSLAVIGWLIPGKSITSFIQDLQFGQMQHMADLPEMPEHSWTRVDIVAVVAKWLKINPGEGVQVGLMLALIAVPTWIVYRLREIPASASAGSLSSAVTLLSMNVTLYRHYYDMLVLVVPLVACFIGAPRLWAGVSRWERGWVGCLILAAMFNYLSTALFFDRVEVNEFGHQIITSFSGLCLCVALLITLQAAWRIIPTARGIET